MTIEAPLWLQGVTYAARMDRHIIDVLFTAGVINANTDLKVTQRAAGANMSVDVAIGKAVVAGGDQTDQGSYFVHVTLLENAVIGAAPGSNSRYDLVVLRIKDPNAGGPAGNVAVIDVIQGVAGASPAVPATPASCLALAKVLVTTGDTTVVNAKITDLRVQSQAQQIKVGTQAEPMTTAARDALSGGNLYDGRLIFNTTTNRFEYYSTSATAWRTVEYTASPSGVQIASGSYSGDGTTDRTIALPFTPKMVFVSSLDAGNAGLWSASPAGTASKEGFRADVNATAHSNANLARPNLTTNGFIISGTGSNNETNTSGKTFYYVAIG